MLDATQDESGDRRHPAEEPVSKTKGSHPASRIEAPPLSAFVEAPPSASQPESATSEQPSVPSVPDHELLRCIGRGSYGQVWLARNVTGNYRAIKFVHRQTFETARPYEREFDGIKRYEPISRGHESQVDILHVGRNEQAGYFYYVMELADSSEQPLTSSHKLSTLDALNYRPRTLRVDLQSRGRLPVAECVEIGLSLTTALAHLHEHGLVHRDVKPSNIIFVGGRPKLADIGLVSDADKTISFVGTEGYYPPEGPGKPQADLYSLGKVLYEICTGKDRQAFPEPATRVGEFADREALLELQEIIEKACAADLRDRYESAEEMQADLLLLKTGKSVRQTHQSERRLATARRVGRFALMALGLAIGAYCFQKSQTRRAEENFQQSERQRLRAEKAERSASLNLREAYVEKSRANRLTGRPGQRFESIEALARAVDLTTALNLPQEKLLEMRNEAIACMTLPDLRLAEEWPGQPQDGSMASFDDKFERYARNDTNGNISVRQVKDHRQFAFLPRPGTNNEVLRLSPDGRFVAAVYFPLNGYARGRTFDLWDVKREKVILELPSGIHHHCVDFSRDSRWMCLALHAGPIVMYELPRPSRDFRGDAGSVGLADGVHSQAPSTDATNATTMAVAGRFPVPGEPSWLRLSPDNRLLAISDYKEPVVRIFEVETGQLRAVLTHPKRVECVDWQTDSQTLATACFDWNIYLWDIVHTQQVALLKGHTGEPVVMGFSHDGRVLASRGWDNFLRLWDTGTGRQLLNLACKAGPLQFSPDDRWLGMVATGHGPGLAPAEVATARECRMLGGHANAGVTSASFHTGGRLLATIGNDAVLWWDVVGNRQAARLPFAGGRGIVVHRNGQSFLASGTSGLYRWPLACQERAGVLAVSIGPQERLSDLPNLQSVSLSPNGRRLAVGQLGAGARLFDLDHPTSQPRLLEHPNAANVSFSPDGQWLVTGTWQGKGVKLWDGESGKFMREINNDMSCTVQFSPEGRWLVTGTGQGFRFWETRSWQARHAIDRERGGNAGGAMSFSPDGKMLVITHLLHGVRLIEAGTGRELATLEAANQHPLCFGQGGSQLVTADVLGSVYLWDLRLISEQLAAIKLNWDTP